MFRTILYPTDFSPLGNAALPYAVLLASAFRSKLALLHVMTRDEQLLELPSHFQIESGCLNELSALIDKAMKRLNDRLPAELSGVHYLVESGLSAAHEIVHQAAVNKADLIVMATHGHGAVAHELIGSVTENVIHHSPCAVVALRLPKTMHSALSPLHLNIRRILLPTDLSVTSLQAFAIGAALAKPFHAGLSAVYVTPDPDTAAAQAALEQFVQLNYTGSSPLTYVASSGEPADRIIACAAHENADLIAMTTQGHNQLKDVLFGSTTERVLHNAPCPLLVVRAR